MLRKSQKDIKYTAENMVVSIVVMGAVGMCILAGIIANEIRLQRKHRKCNEEKCKLDSSVVWQLTAME